MKPEDFKPDDLFTQIEGLVETVDAERRLRERAEAADRAKSDLLAVVSHELRTPMGAVISMSELLLNGPLDPTQRHYAETLQQSAKSLLTVLNDILDYSKLEAGRFELDSAVFDLHELVRSVGSECRRGRGRKVSKASSISVELPAFRRRRCEPCSPGAHKPHRQRREVHLSRLGASACQCRRCRR